MSKICVVRPDGYLPPPKHSRQLTVRLDLIALGKTTKPERIKQAAADARIEIAELRKTIRRLQSLLTKTGRE